MTGSARGILSPRQQLVRWFHHLVIAVAGHACRLSEITKRLIVRALVEELRRRRVAVAADICHRIDARRGRAVVTMAARIFDIVVGENAAANLALAVVGEKDEVAC